MSISPVTNTTMSLIAFLTSAVGGTLLSGATQFAQEWFAVRRAKAESEMKIAELKALSEIKIEEKQLEAFVKAQGSMESSWKPDTRTPLWIVCAYGLAEITIKLVRPAMVLMSFWLVAKIYAGQSAVDQNNLDAEILTFCFSVGYFWLGQRYQRSHPASKK